MNSIVRLELPLPPSANRYWRMGPNRAKNAKYTVVTHLSSEGREYRRLVRMVWLSRRAGREQFTGPVYVFGALFLRTKASDVDNRIKPALDALEAAGVVENDRQVAELTFFRAGIVGLKHSGALLLEVGSYEWVNQTVEEFKRAAGWEKP